MARSNKGVYYLFYTYKKRASKLNIKWNLDRELFGELIRCKCFYCGKIPKQRANLGTKYKISQGKSIPYNGIDRVNNKKGYDISNVVPCCGTCNKMKLDLPLKQFFTHIINIHDRHIDVNKKRNK